MWERVHRAAWKVSRVDQAQARCLIWGWRGPKSSHILIKTNQFYIWTTHIFSHFLNTMRYMLLFFSHNEIAKTFCLSLKPPKLSTWGTNASSSLGHHWESVVFSQLSNITPNHLASCDQSFHHAHSFVWQLKQGDVSVMTAVFGFVPVMTAIFGFVPVKLSVNEEK